MRQTEPLYVNETGMAFFWMDQHSLRTDKVQLVFKETGFHLSCKQLHEFADLIKDSGKRNHNCNQCSMQQRCSRFLLKTPLPQVDLAVSMDELMGIEDLVCGALFKLELRDYLNKEGRN